MILHMFIDVFLSHILFKYKARDVLSIAVLVALAWSGPIPPAFAPWQEMVCLFVQMVLPYIDGCLKIITATFACHTSVLQGLFSRFALSKEHLSMPLEV